MIKLLDNEKMCSRITRLSDNTNHISACGGSNFAGKYAGRSLGELSAVYVYVSAACRVDGYVDRLRVPCYRTDIGNFRSRSSAHRNRRQSHVLVVSRKYNAARSGSSSNVACLVSLTISGEDTADLAGGLAEGAVIEDVGVYADIMEGLVGYVYGEAGGDIDSPFKVEAVAAGLAAGIRRIGVNGVAKVAGAAVGRNVRVAEGVFCGCVGIGNSGDAAETESGVGVAYGDYAVSMRRTHGIAFALERPPCGSVCKEICITAEGDIYTAGNEAVGYARVAEGAGINVRELVALSGSIIVVEAAVIILGASKLIPGSAVLGNLNGARLGVARERISVDDKVYAIRVLIVVGNAVSEIELDVAAERAEGYAGGIKARLTRELAGAGSPAAAGGKLADGQIAYDGRGRYTRGNRSSRSGRAGNGIGGIGNGRHHNGISGGAGGDGIGVVAGVRIIRVGGYAVYHYGRSLGPKGEACGDNGGVVSTLNGSVSAGPVDISRVARTDADGIVNAEIEGISIAVVSDGRETLMNVCGHGSSTVGKVRIHGVGAAGGVVSAEHSEELRNGRNGSAESGALGVKRNAYLIAVGYRSGKSYIILINSIGIGLVLEGKGRGSRGLGYADDRLSSRRRNGGHSLVACYVKLGGAGRGSADAEHTGDHCDSENRREDFSCFH